jgi:hypothetical protein
MCAEEPPTMKRRTTAGLIAADRSGVALESACE